MSVSTVTAKIDALAEALIDVATNAGFQALILVQLDDGVRLVEAKREHLPKDMHTAMVREVMDKTVDACGLIRTDPDKLLTDALERAVAAGKVAKAEESKEPCNCPFCSMMVAE